MLTAEQVDQLAAQGGASTTTTLNGAVLANTSSPIHTWEERWQTLSMVRDGHGGLLRRHPRLGETLRSARTRRRACAELAPSRSRRISLNPRPGTCLPTLEVMPVECAQRWPPSGYVTAHHAAETVAPRDHPG